MLVEILHNNNKDLAKAKDQLAKEELYHALTSEFYEHSKQACKTNASINSCEDLSIRLLRNMR